MEQEKTTRSVMLRAFWTEAFADKNVLMSTNELLQTIDGEGLAKVEEVHTVNELIAKMQEFMKHEWFMNYALYQNGTPAGYTREYSVAKKFLSS